MTHAQKHHLAGRDDAQAEQGNCSHACGLAMAGMMGEDIEEAEGGGMSHYRRRRVEGGCHFFTVVTWNRSPLFRNEMARCCLRRAWNAVRQRRPFEVVALCLLPDHLHCTWQLPEGDAEYSRRWAAIKAVFSREYLRGGGREGRRNGSRHRREEVAIWQRRFWEHQIRGLRDMEKHVDYIHWNPVKHGFVDDPSDWPWSTYHRYMREGYYTGHPLCPDNDDAQTISEP